VIRQVALLTVRDDAKPEETASLEAALANAAQTTDGLLHSQAARHLEGSLCADYTWDALVESSTTPTLESLLSSPALAAFFAPTAEPPLVSHHDIVRFEPQEREIHAPEIRDCIKRTLLLRVLPDAPPESRTQFETDVMRMPAYIPSIRNWAFSRTDPALAPTGWTHVWEQEYEDLSGLHQDYMMSPFHWGLIDNWFDPECPQRIVENRFAHVFCGAEQSVLAWQELR